MNDNKVVIVVRGGVAECISHPDGVVVEIRDYDTEGCDESTLEEDGCILTIEK